MDIAKLVARLELQSSQFQTELEKTNRKLLGFQKQTNKSLSSIEKQARSFGNTMKGVFAAVGVGAAIRSVIRATSEAEESFAQLEAAVKSTGGAAGFTAPQLAQMATDLQNVTTHADDSIQSMQAVLLTFTKIAGPEFAAAEEAILNVATRLKTDLKSAALQVGKALNDPIKGATALARSGIQLSDSQKNLIERLQKTGDVAGAQRVILKELEVQFGGAATAARQNFGGALAGLKNAFDDLLEAKGGLPGAADSINNLTETLNDPNVKAGFDNLTAGAITALSWLGKLAGGAATAAVSVGEFFAELQHGPDTPGGVFAEEMKALEEKQKNLFASIRSNEDASSRTVSKVLKKNFDDAKTRALAELAVVEKRMDIVRSELRQLDAIVASPAVVPPASPTGGGGSAALLSGWTDADRERVKAAESFRSFMDSLDEGVKQGFTETLKGSADQLDDLTVSFETATDEISVYADEAARNMQGAFADFLFDPFDDGLKGMLKGFIDVIRRMMAETAAAKIFGSKDSGGFGFADVLGSLFGMFDGPSAKSTAGITGSGPQMATGTNFVPFDNFPAMLHRGEAVVPAKYNPAAGGSITVVNNNTFNNVRDVTDAKMAVYAQRISDVTLARVRDDRRRGKA